MPRDESQSIPTDPSQAGQSFGDFRVQELLDSNAERRVYRARDEQVARSVVLHVVGEAGAGSLLDDARRLAAVSHPGLVVVLGASRSERGGYAAVQDVDAMPLCDAGSLSSEEAARVAIDIAGAIEALSQSGMRASVDRATVLVSRTRDGIRGVLDPLRALAPGQSCLAEADAPESTKELADLLAVVVPAPDDVLRSAIEDVRSAVATAPSELARSLMPLAAPPRAAGGKRTRIAALCVAAVAAAGIAAVVLERSDGPSKQIAAPVKTGPAARVVARIPLGMSGDEGAAAFAFVGRTVWVATSTGRLIRVDSATNQVAGSPLVLGKQHPLTDMRASEDKLYTIDYSGWLLRIDPRTRRVTGRRHFDAPLTALSAVGGVLWIATSRRDTSGVLRRVDAKTLGDVAAPLDGLPDQLHRAQVDGSKVWVLGGSETGVVARVDTSTGERRLAYVGPLPTTIRLGGGTLWITDRFSGTVSALDADRMAFVREALHLPRSAFDVVPAAPDLWITAATETSIMRVERFDARTGRRAGRAVELGRDNGRLGFGLGSLWAATGKDLVRLAPTMPRPPLGRGASTQRSPRTFRPGPLSAGPWRTDAFLAPFTFSPPAFTWLGVAPGPDVVGLIQTGGRRIELDVIAPRQAFAEGTTVRPVTNPAGVLKLLRANRHLRVGVVEHVEIGGRPALQFVLRNRDPVRHPDVCGPRPCTLLFPSRESTLALLGNDVFRLSLLTSAGHTLVVAEGYDEAALAQTEPLLRTFRFAK